MRYIISSSRLKQALNSKNMTARELSNKSGVSEASISQYINGTHKPGNLSSGKMAKVLECDPVWLMGFEMHSVTDSNTSNTEKKSKSSFTLSDLDSILPKDFQPNGKEVMREAINVYEFGHDITSRMANNKDFFQLIYTAMGIDDKDLSTAISILEVFRDKNNNS